MQSALVLSVLAWAGEGSALAFDPLEIYLADDSACCLKVVDVDADGRNDLAYVDNSQATIRFLIQKSAEQLEEDRARPPEYDPRKPNDLPSDRRFRSETYLTEKRVFCWDLLDLTGDGVADLVFYGDPRELVLVPGEAGAPGELAWGDERTWRVPEGAASTQALATGDFDGDGRADVALLGKEDTTFWSGEDGGLGDPRDVPNTVRGAYGMLAGDYDGDGRTDLLYVGPGDEPLSVRLQGRGGLGPTLAFRLAGPRDWAVGDVTGDGTTDLVYVDDVSGRLRVHRLERRAAGDGANELGGARTFPLPADDAAKTRRHAVADVDGDGRADVLVTQPAAARVHVYLQGPEGLGRPRAFATLSKTTALEVVDLAGGPDPAGNGPAVLVLSPDERAIGVTRWGEHGLAFPDAIPVAGKPSAFAAGDVDGDGRTDLAVVTKDGRDLVLLVDLRGVDAASGEGIEAGAEGVLARKLDDVKDAPERMTLFDVDRDGRLDVVMLFGHEPLKVLLNRADDEGGVELVDVSTATRFGRGLIEDAVPESLLAADYDGDGLDELIVAKENFARAFRVGGADEDDAGSVVVLDQFSARGARAQVVGVGTVDLDGDGRREVVLYDKKANELSVQRFADGESAIVDTVEVPALSFRGLSVADLDGDGREDVLLAGEDRLVLFPVGGERWAIEAQASFAPDHKDGRLNRVAVGTLDGGAPEVLVVDTSKQELLVLGASDGELEERTTFRVFEAKAFQRQVTLDEPRELVAGDVTGDGVPDLVALAHDRVLVYPGAGGQGAAGAHDQGADR